MEPKYGEIDPRTPEGRRAIAEQNRLSWNEATRAHNSHKADQAKFLCEGGTTLNPEEIGLLGDVRGKTVLHLQCNAGQDTLSIAQLGATVTGVDISDEAINFARDLSTASGIPATFHRADVYEWLEDAAGRNELWDVVFCSYGAIIWLGDLNLWAKGIAAVLEPGGRFVTVEFHPVEMMFESDYSHRYPYSTHGASLTWDDGIGDYVNEYGTSITPSGWLDGVQDFENPHRAHEFAWGLGETVTALLEAGLALESLTEYDYSPMKLFGEMKQLDDHRWTVKDGVPPFPLMYSLTAQKR